MLVKKLLPAAVLLSFVAALGTTSCQQGKNSGSPTSDTLTTTDGFTYRDLNKNGKLDIYEDRRQPVAARVDDLLKQMNIEEKAGELFINGAKVNDDGSLDDKPAKGMFAFVPNALKVIREKKMNHFNLWAVPSPAALAKWYNAMQRWVQDSTRLGIPITVASDPRNHFSNNIFAMTANTFLPHGAEPLGPWRHRR